MKKIDIAALWKKYKFVVFIILAGVLLMMLPSGKKTQTTKKETTGTEETFSLKEMEEKMTDVLSHIQGVGKIRVMLTLKSGSQLHLAEDISRSDKENDTKYDSETVTVNRGSGSQEVVVTNQIYPTYQGAVIVCQGAGQSSVRLAVTEAVAALTGLSADKISVVKWNS
ncbi:MAG: stage III sporulation protein AG [Eubacteriales bacterium]|nr:stage III sporulation protein AG [Eubacteriales bacterium]